MAELLNFVTGTAGNDTIDVGAASAGVAGFATDGFDVIAGGLGNDLIHSGDSHDRAAGDTKQGIPNGDDAIPVGDHYGSDTIYGEGGPDLLIGDVDTLSAGTYGGNDILYGGDDLDTIYGDGNQLAVDVFGGADSLHGDDGDDILFGDAGNFSGGKAGNDLLEGGDGSDILYGDAGTLGGGAIAGADTLTGGDGNDILVGDGRVGDDQGFVGGKDKLDGGAGDDNLNGNAGADTLVGGSGADQFHFDPSSGKDKLTDFKADEGDTLNLAGYFTDSGKTLDDILGNDGVLGKGDLGVKAKGSSLTIDFGVMFGTADAKIDTVVIKGVHATDGDHIVTV